MNEIAQIEKKGTQHRDSLAEERKEIDKKYQRNQDSQLEVEAQC